MAPIQVFVWISCLQAARAACQTGSACAAEGATASLSWVQQKAKLGRQMPPGGDTEESNFGEALRDDVQPGDKSKYGGDTEESNFGEDLRDDVQPGDIADDLPACQGDSTLFDAFGIKCDTYDPTHIHGCKTDQDLSMGLSAGQVCPQCGQCGDGGGDGPQTAACKAKPKESKWSDEKCNKKCNKKCKKKCKKGKKCNKSCKKKYFRCKTKREQCKKKCTPGCCISR